MANRRYNFLTDRDVFEAFNRLEDAFLAAKDGNEVKEIINSLLTSDEKIKIGRRILIAEALQGNLTLRDIREISNVGSTTLLFVSRKLSSHPKGFELIKARKKKLENEYQSKKYKSIGGSKLVYKKKEYTGIKRSDIKR